MGTSPGRFCDWSFTVLKTLSGMESATGNCPYPFLCRALCHNSTSTVKGGFERKESRPAPAMRSLTFGRLAILCKFPSPSLSQINSRGRGRNQVSTGACRSAEFVREDARQRSDLFNHTQPVVPQPDKSGGRREAANFAATRAIRHLTAHGELVCGHQAMDPERRSH